MSSLYQGSLVLSLLKNTLLSSSIRLFTTLVTLEAETLDWMVSVLAISAASSLIAERMAISPTRLGWLER
jgi:hypothetical protein